MKIEGNQKSSLSGSAAPKGGTVELINLTVAASNHQQIDEYAEAGKVDGYGKFEIPLTGQWAGIQEGDYVRLRVKDKDGKVLETIDTRISGRANTDTRSAPLVTPRLSLYAADDGNAYIYNGDRMRPASEPYAQFKLSNPATGESKTIIADADGNLPDAIGIKAKYGETLMVYSADGKAVSTGQPMKVGGHKPHAKGEKDLDDPKPLDVAIDPKGRVMANSELHTGALWDAKPSPDDVKQRYIGDCFVAGAAGSIAKFRPKTLMGLFTKDKDGTYYVTFNVYNDKTKAFDKKTVHVDGDLYRDENGVIYGASLPSDDPKAMKLWWPILEKAYAKFLGGYQKIGDGGYPEAFMEAVLGMKGWKQDPADEEELWKFATRAVNAQLPSALATSDDDKRYKDTGIHGNHTYSILGYGTDAKTKERYLILRNPWGEDEPGNDGKNDGTFKFALKDCKKLFDTFYSVK